MEILVTGSQMKQCDKNTIETFGVPSLVLMERAALGVAEEIEGYFAGQGRERERSALIACGHGNNGGDGLAIGRILWQRGYETTILMPPGNGKLSEETKVQKEILSKYGIAITDAMPSQEFGVIVDALFGIGLTRELQGVYREYIEGMNRKTGLKVAVDIPSGIHADTGAVMGIGFRADVTVAFAYAKLGLLLYPGAEYAGRVLVKEIGISRHSFLGEQPSVFALGTEDIGLIPARAPYSNKGTFGKVLTIAGQKNMAGAAFLSGMASYVTGAGMVRVFTEEANREILQALLPEAILTTYGGAGNQPGQEENLEKQLEEALSWATVAAAGPGLGTGKRARRLIKHLLKKAEIPVVLDADGLNLAAESPEWLKEAKAPVIVTPHLGEMARLTGSSIPKIQQGLLQALPAFRLRAVLRIPHGILPFAGSPRICGRIPCGMRAERCKDSYGAAGWPCVCQYQREPWNGNRRVWGRAVRGTGRAYCPGDGTRAGSPRRGISPWGCGRQAGSGSRGLRDGCKGYFRRNPVCPPQQGKQGSKGR